MRAIVAMVCLLLGGAAYVHWHRFAGGPLSDPSFGGIGLHDVTVGRPLAFTEIFLDNHSGHRVTIERVTPHETIPGTDVRMWIIKAGATVRREAGPFSRVRGANLRSPTGLVIPAHAHDVQLIAEVTPTRPGCMGLDGLIIDYRAGLLHYRRVARDLFFLGGSPGAHHCETPHRSG